MPDQSAFSLPSFNVGFPISTANGGTGTSTTLTTGSGVVAGASGIYTSDTQYTKFGNASPFSPVITGAEVWGDENNINGVEFGLGNRNSGTSAYGFIFLNNDLASSGDFTHYAGMGLNSSTYTDTTFGTAFAVANQLQFINTDGDICYAATKTGKKQIWYAGGNSTSNEAMRLQSTGLSVRTTSQPGVVSIGAGTTSLAAISLTTGTNKTTPASGDFEYDGTKLNFTNAGAQRQELLQQQQAYVTTIFTTSSNTTLANVTGLSATVVSGKTYRFEAFLFTASTSGGGVKFAVGGTATATSTIIQGASMSSGTTYAGNNSRATALGTAVGSALIGDGICRINGEIVVNAGGTLTIQFAQNTSNGADSSVLVGSYFVVTQLA